MTESKLIQDDFFSGMISVSPDDEYEKHVDVK